MSTPPVTPDQQPTSNLGATVAAPDSGANDDAAYQNWQQQSPTQQATASPSAPQNTPSQSNSNSGANDLNEYQQQQAAKPTSRLGAIVSAVSTALAGIPAGRRSDFASGLGEGARAEQQAQATQQAIKFQSFDDQVRLAQLHNQDLKMQNDTQAQQDAHNEAELHMRQMANDLGIDYNTIANHGPAVMDNLASQTATNGAASVPPGTHVSSDGQNIYVPKDTQATRDGQMQMYSNLAPIFGLASLPPGTQFVPPKSMDMLTDRLQGFGTDGNPIKHGDLPGVIGAEQAQRDQLAKNGATPDQLKALDNTIAIHQANLKALDDHANQQLDAAEAIKTKYAKQLQDNAAGNKQPKPQNTQWVPGVTADEKKKAELGENIAENSNAVAQMLIKRPDLVGAVAGRFTSTEQMIGNNDPDIAALGTRIHNIAMANSGVHGFRSQEGVQSFEKQVLNNFRNGPQAVAGALKATTGSVQTFIDNARPDSYKTHSKQGGALRGMMETQQ